MGALGWEREGEGGDGFCACGGVWGGGEVVDHWLLRMYFLICGDTESSMEVCS